MAENEPSGKQNPEPQEPIARYMQDVLDVLQQYDAANPGFFDQKATRRNTFIPEQTKQAIQKNILPVFYFASLLSTLPLDLYAVENNNDSLIALATIGAVALFTLGIAFNIGNNPEE